MNFAQEFSPEMDQNYLSSLLHPIEDQGAVDEGRARSEAASRGLTGQALEGSMIGSARANTARQKSDTISKFNFDIAGLKRGERLTQEKETYDAAQAEKDRQFKERMANLGYQFESGRDAAQRGFEKDEFWQTLPVGIAGGIASSAVGGYFGGLGKKA